MFVNVDKNGILSVFKSVNRIEEIVWIEATKKQEKIQLTKFPFRIGKKEDANYRICNSAVSRKHVDILKEQGEYFLVDLGSTNGTYIDGKKLQPGVKEKICNGSVVRFADEEYKFYISQGE